MSGRCPGCCHWTVPLSFAAGNPSLSVKQRGLFAQAQAKGAYLMPFEQWLLYHLHINHHQRLFADMLLLLPA